MSRVSGVISVQEETLNPFQKREVRLAFMAVLANTNLNVLTAVFYWFTLTCDEPFLLPFQYDGWALKRDQLGKNLIFCLPFIPACAFAGRF